MNTANRAKKLRNGIFRCGVLGLLEALSRFYSGRTVYSMPPLASWLLTTL